MKDQETALQRDLKALTDQILNRRRALTMLASAVTLLPLVACGASDQLSGDASTGTTGSGGSGTGGTTDSSADGTCSVIPEETEGPYPGDGSNGKNALQLSGIVRSDIRSSIGTASAVAAGIPLTIELTLIDGDGGCGSLEGFAIYLWHCDRDGNYSMYSSAVASENYLRGVQATDAAGKATFVTIFPGCYDGRYPHVHFEVFSSLAKATSSTNKVATSQLALPGNACSAVYATTGYTNSAKNLARTSLAKDGIFSDGYSLQLATVEGDVSQGYTAKLTVAIKT